MTSLFAENTVTDNMRYYGAPEEVIYTPQSDWLPEELKAEIDDWIPNEGDVIEDEKVAGWNRLQEAFETLFQPGRHFCNAFQLHQTAKRLADLWHCRVTRYGFSYSMDIDFADPPISDCWSISFNNVTGKNAEEWLSEVSGDRLRQPGAEKCRTPVKITAVKVSGLPLIPAQKVKMEAGCENGASNEEEENFYDAGAEEADLEETKMEQAHIGTPTAKITSNKNLDHLPMPLRDPSLLFSKDFSDIRFICTDGAKIYAHKMILAAASPRLDTILKKFKGKQQWEVPYASQVMKTILKHVYHGQIDSRDLNLAKDPLPFLSFACKYGLTDLQRMAIAATMCSLKPSNIASVLKMTDMYNLKDLRQACFQFAKHNPVDVLSELTMVELGCRVPELWKELIRAIHQPTQDAGGSSAAQSPSRKHGWEEHAETSGSPDTKHLRVA